MFPTSFEELIVSLQGPGAVALLVWFASWALDDIAGWQALAPKVKSLIILGVAIVFGVGAVWFGGHPEWVAAAEPYVKAVLAVCAAWLASQVAHKADK